MSRPRLLSALITIAFLTACQQGATVGGYPGGIAPVGTSSSGPTTSPSPSASSSASSSASASPGASASPVGSPSASASTSAVGPLVFSPSQIDFGVTSVLGSSQSSTVSQAGYSGPFTLAPTNPIVCSGGLLNIPVTATIVGNVVEVTLGALGVTGSCIITVDGAPGTSGSLPVALTIPVTTPPSPSAISFVPDPVSFNVLNAVTGNTATTTIVEAGYTGAFTLPASAISCPFNLLPLTKLTATISGDILTLTTGPLNANLLGTCVVTVDDSAGRSGQLTVNFQLL